MFSLDELLLCIVTYNLTMFLPYNYKIYMGFLVKLRIRAKDRLGSGSMIYRQSQA